MEYELVELEVWRQGESVPSRLVWVDKPFWYLFQGRRWYLRKGSDIPILYDQVLAGWKHFPLGRTVWALRKLVEKHTVEEIDTQLGWEAVWQEFGRMPYRVYQIDKGPNWSIRNLQSTRGNFAETVNTKEAWREQLEILKKQGPPLPRLVGEPRAEETGPEVPATKEEIMADLQQNVPETPSYLDIMKKFTPGGPGSAGPGT